MYVNTITQRAGRMKFGTWFYTKVVDFYLISDRLRQRKSLCLSAHVGKRQPKVNRDKLKFGIWFYTKVVDFYLISDKLRNGSLCVYLPMLGNDNPKCTEIN
ncbi:hypothetical protein AVEN_8116-1 [Araneus ventricosus]|uniref:Uncharacterized protein n=1 Tax=Araneus ventricosus TaxID=182803 RepID=A0A4Y2WA77_ARAVE|nr:hypothetical protein AVEN_8116-1 [Araneus ventricosus]